MNKNNFRKEKLIQKQNEILEEKEEEVKRKKERQMSQLDKAIEDMRQVGLWNSEEQIRSEVQKLKTKKEKMDVLKKQLNIYKKVFKIDKDKKELLQFSSKGKVHDVDKLMSNLLELVRIRRSEDTCIQRYQPHELVGKNIIHTWTMENGENKDWEAEIRSYENGVFKVILIVIKNINFTRIKTLQHFCMPLNNIAFGKHTLVVLVREVTIMWRD